MRDSSEESRNRIVSLLVSRLSQTRLEVTRERNEFIAFRSTGGAQDKRAELVALPLRILTYCGAQVALQRCPILRAGSADCTTMFPR